MSISEFLYSGFKISLAFFRILGLCVMLLNILMSV